MKQKRCMKLNYTVYYAMLIRVVMLAGVGNGLLYGDFFTNSNSPTTRKSQWATQWFKNKPSRFR